MPDIACHDELRLSTSELGRKSGFPGVSKTSVYPGPELEPSREPFLSSPLVTRAARLGVVVWALIGVSILGFWTYHFVVYPVRIIFPPIVVAMVVVYLLNPVVSIMERRRVPRVWGALLLYAVFLTAVGVGLSYLVPVVSNQVHQLNSSGSGLIARAQTAIQNLGSHLGISLHLKDIFAEIQRTRPSAVSFLGRITSYTTGVIHIAIIVILGPVLGFYVLVDLPKLKRAVHAAIPARRREEFEDVGAKVSAAIGGFFRGQLLVAASVGLGAMLGLYIVGLPYWAVIGLSVGLFNLVPMIGPYIGALPALFVAFTAAEPDRGLLIHPHPGLPLAVAAGIALLIVQNLDSHIVSPNIVGRTVKLHPITVMLSLLAGGTVLGLWGMLLAVPTVATAKILLVHYWDTRVSWPPKIPATAGAEDSAEGGADGATRPVGEAADPRRPGRLSEGLARLGLRRGARG